MFKIQHIKDMKNYHDIKQNELENTKSFSSKELNKYIKSHKILLKFYSEEFFWSLSFIVFMLFALILSNTSNMFLLYTFLHFIFWFFWGKKKYHRDCDDERDNLKLTIQVLEDIKEERNL
jgi:hypothetical protein